jgi:glyoxylase-like metal-dependent hydrolase (beta-lactamase superfamily II)
MSVGMHIGSLVLHPLSDGTFVARPEYFGASGSPVPHPEFFSRDGAAWLPIGCFLLRAGQRLVLIDAGLGPDLQHLPHGMYLAGGQLLTGLRALGVSAADITDVICSHLHGDHVGWLFDAEARPVFTGAAIWIGQGDWHHFVAGPGEMLPHIREGFRAHALSGRLHLIDRDTTVAAGITARLAPGHTPGHLCVVVSSGPQRAILLGDAITCPIQLDEPAWHSFGDVDPVLAAQTREGLWQELEDEHTTGAGAHFPEIRFGRVRTGAAGRRFSYPEGDPR